jgi:hypothetical protein
VTFSNDKDLTGLFTGLPNGQTHNVVVNEDSDYIYSVGAQPRNSTCRSGLIFIDVSDPSQPTSPGCASAEGYVHDAQCKIYNGPHTKYIGREICYGKSTSILSGSHINIIVIYRLQRKCTGHVSFGYFSFPKRS